MPSKINLQTNIKNMDLKWTYFDQIGVLCIPHLSMDNKVF